MTLEAVIAANRFGLGARPSELAAIRGDPRGWLAKVGAGKLDAFLRGYFDHFAFRSITTGELLDYLRANLPGLPAVVSQAKLQEWMTQPGLPADAVIPTSDAFVRIDAQRARWLGGTTPATELPAQEWSTQEWLHFLDNMPQRLEPAQLAELDQAFGFTRAGNSEIAHSWLRVAIRNRYEPAMPRLEEYLVKIGRRKLIKPLYEDLMKTDWGPQVARRIYAKARPGYHPMAVATIDGIVTDGAPEASEPATTGTSPKSAEQPPTP